MSSIMLSGDFLLMRYFSRYVGDIRAGAGEIAARSHQCTVSQHEYHMKPARSREAKRPERGGIAAMSSYVYLLMWRMLLAVEADGHALMWWYFCGGILRRGVGETLARGG